MTSEGTGVLPTGLFRRAVDRFGGLVHAVGADQWHGPTPCADWDVRTLVNHVAVEQLWVPPLMQGRTVAEVGRRLDGDQLADDPGATWDTVVGAAVAEFAAPDAGGATVAVSSGPKPAAEYCWEMTTDALIHSWDLAAGIGADQTLDAELVEVVFERTVPIADELQKTGLFAPPVATRPGADLQTRLLALFGRDAVQWS